MYGATEPLQPTPELNCSRLGPVLSQMSTLRKLAVHDLIIVSPGELWRALGCIRGLQDLRLTFCQVHTPSRLSSMCGLVAFDAHHPFTARGVLYFCPVPCEKYVSCATGGEVVYTVNSVGELQIEEQEAELLVTELQRLQELRVLDLHGNHLLGPGALAIARVLSTLRHFERVELGMNEIDEEYDDAIAALRKDLATRGISLNTCFSQPMDT